MLPIDGNLIYLPSSRACNPIFLFSRRRTSRPHAFQTSSAFSNKNGTNPATSLFRKVQRESLSEAAQKNFAGLRTSLIIDILLCKKENNRVDFEKHADGGDESLCELLFNE